ncbi:MAG: carbon monoxide dehydrogenase subunit G [Rubellimicrobium sp.]|nr:carbon monoxide dehydrogenase subunit G [Rubellimicrobium sp.]
MEFDGIRRIAAPRALVWARLNDPAVMLTAIPGCVSFEGSHADGYEAVVEVRLGPLRARFRGQVRISDWVPPEGYRLDARGEGLLLGHAGGTAHVRLDEEDGDTLLRYRITTQMGGRLGSFGHDRVAAYGARLADGFFARLMGEEGAAPDPGDPA